MSTLVIPSPTRPRAATPALTVETILDAERLCDLRPEWTALLADSDADCLFLTWEWLTTWWKHLGAGRRLHVLAVRADGRLIALAPLAVTPGRRSGLAPLASLAFLGAGSVGSDYLDVIAARGWRDEAVDALARVLAGQPLSLDLAQLGPGAETARALVDRLSPRGWRGAERVTDRCPFIPLAGLTWSSYLASLDGHHRSNFRRRLGHLERGASMRFDRVDTEAERAAALAAFFDLHGQRWQERGGSTAFYSPALRRFHEEWTALALGRGWLRLFVMRLDGRPVGAIYGFRYGDTFGFYQTGFDPAHARLGIGQVMVGLSIRSAIEEGAAEYDMLHGTERYKSDWAGQTRELARIEAYPPSWRGRLHRRLVDADRRARRLARAVLARAGRRVA